MLRSEIVKEVQAMMERHWDAFTIAKKLCVDTQVVQEIIKQLLT